MILVLLLGCFPRAEIPLGERPAEDPPGDTATTLPPPGDDTADADSDVDTETGDDTEETGSSSCSPGWGSLASDFEETVEWASAGSTVLWGKPTWGSGAVCAAGCEVDTLEVVAWNGDGEDVGLPLVLDHAEREDGWRLVIRGTVPAEAGTTWRCTAETSVGTWLARIDVQ